MRILHFVDSSGMYGTEAVILELVRHQERRGHSAAIVSIGAAAAGEKDLEREARRRGITVHQVRMMNGPNPRGAFALLKLARDTGADILHSHGYKANILLGMVPRRFRSQPIVCTLHGYTDARGFDRMRLYRWLDLRAAQRADAAVLVHAGMLNNAGLASLDRQSVSIIENGLADPRNCDGVAADPAISAFCRDSVVIGAVGRLSKEKGFDLLITAFHQLVQERVCERLLIMGEGPERPVLERLVASLGLSDRVLLPGFVSSQVHLSLLRVFVVSSLTEGMPICVLEAMRAGVAIVATRVGGVPAVLGNGAGGVLVEPGDVGALKTGIARVLHDDVLARSVVRQSRAAVRSYSSDRMTERYLQLYANLLPATPRRNRSGRNSVAATDHGAEVAPR